nr:retrovirus-related Pol polyprotein from transposon TNT 1-94 [Tanacetum cinerariifolium]
MPLTFQPHSSKERPGLGIMKHTKQITPSGSVTVSETKQITHSVPTEVKNTEQELKLNELTKLVQMLIDEKILKAKANPFPPCTHCGFNDHRPDDCRNYHECEICGSYDHSTPGHNLVIHIKGGVLAESSQSNESSIGIKCNTYGSTTHSTSDHNEFDHFKRGEKIQAAKAKEPTKKMVENQNDVKVKQINSDNGTEFRNHELESFFGEKGISQNFSSPNTLKQNGIAERKNRTLIEAVRTMPNGFSPSGDFEKFILLVPGLSLLSFEGLGFDIL